MTNIASKMLLSKEFSTSSNNTVTKLALTKERLRQHRQTGEIHIQQYTNNHNKNKNLVILRFAQDDS